jgi:hypothetical protein
LRSIRIATISAPIHGRGPRDPAPNKGKPQDGEGKV